MAYKKLQDEPEIELETLKEDEDPIYLFRLAFCVKPTDEQLEKFSWFDKKVVKFVDFLTRSEVEDKDCIFQHVEIISPAPERDRISIRIPNPKRPGNGVVYRSSNPTGLSFKNHIPTEFQRYREVWSFVINEKQKNEFDQRVEMALGNEYGGKNAVVNMMIRKHIINKIGVGECLLIKNYFKWDCVTLAMWMLRALGILPEGHLVHGFSAIALSKLLHKYYEEGIIRKSGKCPKVGFVISKKLINDIDAYKEMLENFYAEGNRSLV